MQQYARRKLANRLRLNKNLFTCKLADMPGEVFGSKGDQWHFIDNGGDILIVAHTDSVVEKPTFKVDSNILACPTLDNRIGVYLALHELPLRGIKADVLLTEGEERCNSTAALFAESDLGKSKKYNWIAEFDRMGYDCALYEYDSPDVRAMVKKHGYNPVSGSYTDICELESMGVKGFNFGVAYNDYHSAKSFIRIRDLVKLIGMFVNFYQEFKGTHMPHTLKPYGFRRGRNASWKTGYAGSTHYYDDYYGRNQRRLWADEYDAGYYSKYEDVQWEYDDNGDVMGYTVRPPAFHYASDTTGGYDRERDYNGEYGTCDICNEVHTVAELAYDEMSECVMCDPCYGKFYGYNTPRFEKRQDVQTCVACGSVHETVKTYTVMGLNEKLCLDCRDHFMKELADTVIDMIDKDTMTGLDDASRELLLREAREIQKDFEPVYGKKPAMQPAPIITHPSTVVAKSNASASATSVTVTDNTTQVNKIVSDTLAKSSAKKTQKKGDVL